jgi:hypothetical protein
MALPDSVLKNLETNGRVVAEVPSPFEDYRDFIELYVLPLHSDTYLQQRYSYLKGCPVAYRIRRFRVESDLVAAGTRVGPQELLDVQDVVLPSLDMAEAILRLWVLDLASLTSATSCEIPF